MGTVKYTGPVASFHCPTNAEIRSLKVHFSPKQLGSGDPSPENVREIVGWDGVEVQQTGKNLAIPVAPYLLPNIWVDNSKVTTTGKGKIYSVYIPCKPNTTYTCSKSVESVVFVICYTKEFPQIGVPIYGRIQHNNQDLTITTGSDAKYLFLWFYNNVYGNETHTYEEVLNTIQIEESASVTHYESYRGRITDYEFGVLGKNKFNAYDWQTDASCINVHDAESLTVSTLAYIEQHNSYDISSTKGIQRTLSFKTKTISLTDSRAAVSLFALKDNGKTVNSSAYIKLTEVDYETEYVLSISPECDTLQFRNWGYNGSVILSDIQLELGSAATAYEPYDPKHTVYGGWVDLISGEVCEEFYKIVVDKDTPVGIMPWLGINTDQTTGEEFTAALWKRSAGVPKAAGYVRMKCYCDTYPYHSLGSSTKIMNTAGMYDGDSYGPSLLLPTSLIGTTTESLAAFMQDKTFTFVYQRSVPVYYFLSPTQLQTFLGHNNVWSNADYVEVEYDLHETQDILARKNFIIANQPHIETASGDIVSFNTDMSAPLKECKIHFSPVQEGEGDPSPDNIRPITSITNINFIRTGKNLFGGNVLKEQLIDFYNNTTEGNNSIGVIWDSENTSEKIVFNKFKPNQQYTFIFRLLSGVTGDITHNIAIKYTDNSYSYFRLNQVANTTRFFISVSDPTKSIDSFVFKKGNPWREYIYYNDCGIFEGVISEEDFEQYKGVSINIDWSNDIGTIYGGYIDLVNGEAVAEWKVVDLGNYEWAFGTGATYYTINFDDDMMIDNHMDPPICTNYNVLRGNMAPPNNTLYYFERGSNHKRRLLITDEAKTGMTAEQFQTAMNGVKLCYFLIDPIHYPFTPETIRTLKGHNYLYSNANGPIELSYWKH